MANIALKRTIALFDGAKHFYIIGEQHPPAAGLPMSGSVESDNLIAFFHKGADIGLEVAGSGLKAMGDEDPF